MTISRLRYTIIFTFILMFTSPFIYAQAEQNTQDSDYLEEELQGQKVYLNLVLSETFVPFLSPDETLVDDFGGDTYYNQRFVKFEFRYAVNYLWFSLGYSLNTTLDNPFSFYILQHLTLDVGAYYPFVISKNFFSVELGIAASFITSFAEAEKTGTQTSSELLETENHVYLGFGLRPNLLFDFLLTRHFGLTFGIDGGIYYVPVSVPSNNVFSSNNRVQAIFNGGFLLGVYYKW